MFREKNIIYKTPFFDQKARPVILVNEVTIVLLFLALILRRDVWVVSVQPYFSLTKNLLSRLLKVLSSSSLIHSVLDLCPQLDNIRDYPIKITQFNIFAEIEDWINQYYQFSGAKGAWADYDLAYKNIICNHFRQLEYPILIYHILSRRQAELPCIFFGFTNEIKKAEKAYKKEPSSKTPNSGLKLMSAINIFIFLIVTLCTLGFAFSKANFFGRKTSSFFLALSDFGDDREIELLESFEKEGRQLIVVSPSHAKLRKKEDYNHLYRGGESDYRKVSELPGRVVSSPSDGFLAFSEYWEVLKIIFVDGCKMFRHYVFLTPTVFFQISILPYRKIKYRAFFSKYKVKYYWGRDPYNVDHILRRKELNRIGGKSLGQSTSFSMTSTIIWPQYRYVNFDQFYVYQTPILERIYGHNWPSDMELVSSGSGWIKKEFFHQRFNPRKKDIAIFCGLFVGETEMVSFIRNVGSFFPDREILLQVRPNVLKTKTGSQFVERCLDGLNNVTHSTESVYDIMLNVQYVISDPSSLVAEALQLGCYSFNFDIPGKQKANIFRTFEGLVFESGVQAKERIRGIESGITEYNIDTYKDLVDLSGISVGDKARIKLGLKPLNFATPLTQEKFLSGHTQTEGQVRD